MKQLCSEIEELKSAVKILQIERDQSSDEDLRKHYESALNIESIEEQKEETPPSSPPRNMELSMLSGLRCIFLYSLHRVNISHIF